MTQPHSAYSTDIKSKSSTFMTSFFSRHSSRNRLQGCLDGIRLPLDILLEIAQRTILPRDILNLCLTSSPIHAYLLPALYASVEFKTFARCQERLLFLLGRPDLARHIRKLILRPSYLMASSPQVLEAECSILRALELLSPNLHLLHTFIWDGHEMPEDRMWSTLRACCPRVRCIGSSVGTRFINPDCELFNFKNLTGFSLVSKWHTSDSHMLPGIEDLPMSLWDMLLYNCDDLEELTIGGHGTSFSTRLFDVRPLIQGRWPRLHTLNLGHTLMADKSGLPESQMQSKDEFSSFVSAHPKLKNLGLPYPTSYPKLDLTHSGVTIESYSGALPYLLEILPFCHLKALKLCAEDHPSWYIPYVRRVLTHLHSLTTFELWVNLSHRIDHKIEGLEDVEARETDHIKLVRSILASCPTLLHFTLSCSTKTKYGFYMKDFWKALEASPKLKSLEIHKVYIPGEEDMAQSALRMARRLPSLETISLRYSSNVWSNHERMSLRQAGCYELITDNDGALIRLIADEQGCGIFRRFSRRYDRNLRPLRDPLARYGARTTINRS